jgi:excinuclease ABC subunit B
MAKTPEVPKKSKTPKSKAHRPEVQPIGPALAELLNPAINRGDAGTGSGTGLQPPPDNSWDRRAGGGPPRIARAPRPNQRKACRPSRCPTAT